MKYKRNYKVALQKKEDKKSVSHKRNRNRCNNIWVSASGKQVQLERSGSDNLDFRIDIKFAIEVLARLYENYTAMLHLAKFVDKKSTYSRTDRIAYNFARSSIVLVLTSFLSPSVVMAQAWQLEPSATVEQSYDDNFRLTTVSEDKIFTTRIAGGLGLKRFTETIDIEGLVRADFAKFSGDTENMLNDTDNSQLLGLKASRKFERTKFGLNFLFIRDAVLRSVNVVEDPRDVTIRPDDTVDNGVVAENVRRYRTQVQPNFNYQLTERSSMGLIYSFNDGNYKNNERTGLSDYQDHALTGRFQTQVREKDALLALLTGSRFDSDSGNTTDSVELQVGLNHDFDETTNVGFTLGGRHTKFNTPTEDNSSDGFVARLRARKIGGLTRFSFRLERRLSPSGIGDAVETNEFNFNITRKLSPLLLFSLRSRGFENESIRTRTSGANLRRFFVQPRLSWQITQNWYFETSYQYTRQKRFDTPDSADNNSVFVSINYRLPTSLE
jgi:hypothetical protein